MLSSSVATRMLLNADLGEGEPVARTRALMRLIDLANIACGGHAGSVASMERTVRLAREHSVAIGAHPGVAADFGRGALALDGDRLEALLLQQISALAAVCKACGAKLHHVKLHGALYHAVENSEDLARRYVAFVRAWFPRLVLVGFAGGRVVRRARAAGMRALDEAFAERGYLPDGRLVPRGEPGDLIASPVAVAERVSTLRDAGSIEARNGQSIRVEAGTICVHSDSPGSVAIARAVRRVLG